MSTSGCRRPSAAVPERHQAEFVDKVDIDPAQVFGPDGLAVDLRALVRRTNEPLRTPVVSTYRFLGSAPTGISRSTNRAPRSPPNPDQDVDQPDPQRQRSILRRERGGRPAALPDPGIGTILQARHVVLVASGRGKAEAVHQLVEGPVSAMWPATALQLHPHVTVFLDTRAASRLQLASYYIETYKANRLAGLLVLLTTLLPGFAGTVLPIWLRTGSGRSGRCLPLCAQHLLARTAAGPDRRNHGREPVRDHRCRRGRR